mmetsp:Transcript_6691/g.16395  ORF Transcript_6691/g.16395 Transcript_6691/m.16395 type:complete len:83 (-) Transcript_6691:8-256(-)
MSASLAPSKRGQEEAEWEVEAGRAAGAEKMELERDLGDGGCMMEKGRVLTKRRVKRLGCMHNLPPPKTTVRREGGGKREEST